MKGVNMEEQMILEVWQMSEIRKAIEEDDSDDFVSNEDMQKFWDRWIKN